MTEAQQTRLLSRLGESSPSQDRLTQLENTFQRAVDELTLYLNLEAWDSSFDPKAVELAALYDRQSRSPDPDAQSISVTEGSLSQKVDYGERSKAEQAIFNSIARYRVVKL